MNAWISGTAAADLLGIARERVLKMRGVKVRTKGVGVQVLRASLPKAKKGKR